jgi:starch phosphorylase
VIESSPELSQALSAISSGVFSPDEPDRYRGLVDSIYNSDWFMVAADFDAYAAMQRRVDQVWRNSADWNTKAVHNTARMAFFSSDRTIREYARDVWNVPTA